MYPPPLVQLWISAIGRLLQRTGLSLLSLYLLPLSLSPLSPFPSLTYTSLPFLSHNTDRVDFSNHTCPASIREKVGE